MDKALRFAKYLNGGYPRIGQRFSFGRNGIAIHACPDSDWAGCSKTRKPTSGGRRMTGQCTLKHWSATQTAIVVPSALESFGRDFGEDLGIVACVDAQAMIGWVILPACRSRVKRPGAQAEEPRA